jgi:hypothetical protein
LKPPNTKHLAHQNTYRLYCFLGYLLLPIATIPIGIISNYIFKISLPFNDIQIIFSDSTPLRTSIIISIIVAPIYYLFTIVNRSEMQIQGQVLTHLIFGLLNASFLFYLNFSPETGLSAFFLVMVPQVLCLHILHAIWVHKYRDLTYRKLLSTAPKNHE